MHFGHQRRAGPERREQQDLMPILILIFISTLSQMMVTPPPYSLNHRSGTGHIHRRQTQTLKVPYYVGASFTEQYSGKDLRSVEEDYISNLSNNCWNEKQQKEGLLYRACYFGDSDLFQRAQRMGTPSCSRLSEIQITIQG